MNKVITGIYKITNIITNEIYVGSAAGKYGIKKRWQGHRSKLSKNNHANPKLQNSWNKYGESKFLFEILEICSRVDCISREQYYIDTLNPQFNNRPMAGSNLGLKHKDSTKIKLSKHFKNRIMTSDHCQKISMALIGYKRGPMTPEHRALRGKKVTIIDSDTNQSYNFNTLVLAAEFLNVTDTAIGRAIKFNYKIKKRFAAKYFIEGT